MSLSRLAIELTTRCNLNCSHCLRERHERPLDFPVDLLDRVLGQASGQYGIKQLIFTGGEPLMHPKLEDVLATAARHDFKTSLVTNGHLVIKRLPLLLDPGIKSHIGHLVISFDGPDEAVHDRIRGAGAYRKALAAVAALKGSGVPLGLKYTIGAHNNDRIESAILSLTHLDPAFIEVSHLSPTPDNVAAGLLAPPAACRRAEDEVRRLAGELKVPITLSAGTSSDQAFFGCAALCHVELYIDAGGRLGFCCMLPGMRSPGTQEREIIADLREVPLPEAHAGLIDAISAFLHERVELISGGKLLEMDRFPCMACARSFGKLDWLGDYPESGWNIRERPGED